MAFRKLQKVDITKPILKIFDIKKLIKIKTNILNLVIEK